MNYLSLSFAVFVVALMVVYYLVPQKMRGVLLLGASLAFYALFDPRYLIFLLAVALTTYLCARAFVRDKGKKALLIGCLIVNTGIWLAIKVLPQWLGAFLGEGFLSAALPGWVVPVGISYYVLQAMGYLVDVYRGKIRSETRFWKYLLFLSWFPAIVQGPISRYGELAPRLTSEKKFSFDLLVNHATMVLFGLVKKLVVADRLSIFVNHCFDSAAQLQGMILYIAAVCYAFQLYTDFSGCVDICRGVSGLFGIELTQNFNAPYLSRSIKEFWGRWHLSLSRWLKDYIYIPLGGNRKGTVRKYINLLITFTVSGIWHGAGLKFIAWGALQAVYQILGECTADWRKKVKSLLGVQPDSFSERLFQILITFHLTVFSWIFFRAGSLTNALVFIRNMLTPSGGLAIFMGSYYTKGVSFPGFVIIAVHIAVMLWLESKGRGKEEWIGRIRQLHFICRWAIYFVLIFDVLLLGAYGTGYSMAGFLYGGF